VILLGPGAYDLVLRATITTGGLQLGVLDWANNQWLQSSYYSSRQTSVGPTDLTVDFKLATPTKIQFVLANFSDKPRPSSWRIEHVQLRGVGPKSGLLGSSQKR
jgi:hypothetical protein